MNNMNNTREKQATLEGGGPARLPARPGGGPGPRRQGPAHAAGCAAKANTEAGGAQVSGTLRE